MDEHQLPDPAGLTHEQRLALLREAERAKAAWEAVTLATLEAIRAEDPSEKQYAIDEVAVALRWDFGYTGTRFALAESLTERLPGVLTALAGGDISAVQAAAIERGIPADVDPGAVAAIEKTVLAYAPTHTLAETCRKVKRDVNREDPEAFARQVKDNRKGRRVWSRPTEPGMTRIGADLPAEGGAEVMAAIDQVAADVPEGDTRTADQRRADALVTIARDVLTNGCTKAGPTPAVVNVTVSLSTLLALEEQNGELNGEPIPADLACTLALDENATWRRWLTTSGGRPIDISSKSYRPSPKLRAFLAARHRRCAFKGCSRRARSCEIDHCEPWPAGDTAPWNTIPLCSRHHHLKHEASGWTVRMYGDGSVEWTTPTGESIEVEPATYPIDSTVVGQNDSPLSYTTSLERLSPTPVVVPNDNGEPSIEPPPF